jgi:bla regulator protein blaR1
LIHGGVARCSGLPAESEIVRRARHPVVLPLALLLAGAGTLASTAPVGAAIASVHRASAATGRLDLAGIRLSYPRLNAAAWILLGLALIGISAIAVALRAGVRQRAAYRRFLGGLAVVGHLSDPDVLVIDDPHPQAFCAGYLRPRVYISQAALKLLGDAELQAVLAHEHHHRRVRDPLRLASGRILSQALFFLPALRALFGRYSDLAELNADGAAVRARGGGRAALASALLAFDASGAGVSPERVDSLLGQSSGWRRPWWLMSASLVALSSLISVTWGASQAASARATLNLPFLSSQPCLAMLTLGPLLGCGMLLVFLTRRAAARRPALSS